MEKKLIVLLIILVLSSFEVLANFDLQVLHTNDVHSRVLQIDDYDQPCKSVDYKAGKCYGGVARRAHLIKKMRAEKKHTLLLDAGDQFQGSSFFAKYRGKEASIFMNMMRYNAMAVGNHEFDNGPEDFADFIEDTQFPVLSANIDASKHDRLNELLLPHTIIRLDGEDIGIVGYTTEETAVISSPGPTVRFHGIEERVQNSVDALRSQGISKIIAVSHSGFGRDQHVAKTVDGLDIIISGHTNTYLANDDAEAEGPYPFVAQSPSKKPVLIVSSYAYGKYLGALDVTFDDNGDLLAWRGDPILLDKTIPEDEEAKGLVTKLYKPIKESDERVVGFLPMDLDGTVKNCRFKQCSLGNAITDGMLANPKAFGAEIAVINSGGIRASIESGSLTMGEVRSVFPFKTKLATYNLSGNEVNEMLEHSISTAEDLGGDASGRFLQVSGLRFKWDAGKPVGERVLSVESKSEFGAYLPLVKENSYKLISNSYILNGGDGFDILTNGAENRKELDLTHRDILIDLANENSHLLGSTEIRIERVN